MAGGVPIVYRGSGSGAIASFDYFDWASGAGYKIFYPSGTNDSVGKSNFLTDRSSVGSPFDDDAGYQTISQESNIENNFDIKFNKSAYVSGTAIISFSIRVSDGGSANLACTIYHVNAAGTETSIGSVTSVTRAPIGSEQYFRECVKIALTSKNFGVGESLRLETKFSQVNATETASFWFDPTGRYTFTETASGATINSRMELHIPFKIDL